MGLIIQNHIVKMYCADALCKTVWSSVIETKKATSSGFCKINLLSASSGNESFAIIFSHKKD